MKTFKPSETELPQLQDLAKRLKQANAQLAAAKNGADAIKKQIAEWLKEKRGLDLETLAIGDMVMIEGVMLIEVDKMNKFDGDGFSLAQPKLFADWKKDFPVKKFKALV